MTKLLTKNRIVKIGALSGLLLAAFIWGISFAFLKDSLDKITPLFLLAIRFSIATLFLFFICLPKLRLINGKTLLHGLIVGVFIALAHVLQTVGCKYTTAGKNAFLTAIYVVMVPFLGAILFKKSFNPLAVISAVGAIVGIGFISLGGEEGINVGDWLTLAGGVLFAVHILFLADFTKKTDVFLLTFLQFLTAALLLCLIAPIFEDLPSPSTFTPEVIGSLAYLGVFSSGIAFLLQSVGQKYLSTTACAVTLSLEAVFGALAGVIILGEQMTPIAIAGCAVILIAVILSQIEANPFKRRIK